MSDSITVDRNPLLDEEVSVGIHFDEVLDKNTIPRYNQTLQNYLKVSVGNNIYNLTKHNRKQLIDKTLIKRGKSGGYFLHLWK